MNEKWRKKERNVEIALKLGHGEDGDMKVILIEDWAKYKDCVSFLDSKTAFS